MATARCPCRGRGTGPDHPTTRFQRGVNAGGGSGDPPPGAAAAMGLLGSLRSPPAASAPPALCRSLSAAVAAAEGLQGPVSRRGYGRLGAAMLDA